MFYLSQVKPWAFKAILQYLYTGINFKCFFFLLIENTVCHAIFRTIVKNTFSNVIVLWLLDRVDIDVDKFDDCIILARQCKLKHLRNCLEVRLREMEMFGEYLNIIELQTLVLY